MPTPLWYGQAGVGMVGSTAARRFDWANDNIYILITSTSEVPAQDTDDFLSDIDANDAGGGTGYTSGTGSQIANCTVTYDGASNTVRLDGDAWEVTSATFTAGNAHIYKNTGNRTTSPPSRLYRLRFGYGSCQRHVHDHSRRD